MTAMDWVWVAWSVLLLAAVVRAFVKTRRLLRTGSVLKKKKEESPSSGSLQETQPSVDSL